LKIHIKRVYDEAARGDGRRVLVDRLWPRGLAKSDAAIDHWARDVAPSNELRRWYGHDPAKWPLFQRRYFTELGQNSEAVAALLREMGKSTVTFLFSSREERLNNAAALKAYLESHPG